MSWRDRGADRHPDGYSMDCCVLPKSLTNLVKVSAVRFILTLGATTLAAEGKADQRQGEAAATSSALSEGKRQAEQLASRGEFVLALQIYEELRNKHHADLTAGERQELEVAMFELGQKTSSIRLSNIEAGTQVFIDGTKVGTTPLEAPLRVLAGRRQLKLFKPGFEVLEKSVDAPIGGEFVLSESLTPEAVIGEVAVQVRLPPGVTVHPHEEPVVLIDGRPLGKAPLRVPLAPGQHRIGLSAQHFAAPEQTVRVSRGEVLDVSLDAQFKPAHLEINARSGTIKLNGAFVAESYFSGRVAPGRYEVLVERTGFDPYRTMIDVAPGAHLSVPVPTAQRDWSSTDSDERSDLDSGAFESGIYFELLGLGLFGLSSTHEWDDACPVLTNPSTGATLDTDCETRAPRGAGLGVRLGLRLAGVFGVEGFALGAGDWSRASIRGLSIPNVPSYLQQMQIGRVGAVLGAGIRLATPGAAVRLSFGLGGGIALRRVYSNVSSLDGSSTNYAAPVGIADLALLLGERVVLGMVGWLEHSQAITVHPDLTSITGNSSGASSLQQLETITVFQGTELFLGPTLGVHFGS